MNLLIINVMLLFIKVMSPCVGGPMSASSSPKKKNHHPLSVSRHKFCLIGICVGIWKPVSMLYFTPIIVEYSWEIPRRLGATSTTVNHWVCRTHTHTHTHTHWRNMVSLQWLFSSEEQLASLPLHWWHTHTHTHTRSLAPPVQTSTGSLLLLFSLL